MKNNQNKDQNPQNRSSSNPENSFEAGKQGKSQGSRTEADQSGRKDISNSLEDDVVGKFGSNNPTPQARTDNEQDSEKRRNNQ